MGPPFTFLAGFLVLFAARELMPSVVGTGRFEHLVWYLPVLLVPFVLARIAQAIVRRQLTSGGRAPVPPRALLRLSSVALPLSLWVVVGPGGWGDLGARLAGSSHLADIALLLLPLFAAEMPRLVVATAAEACLEVADSIGPGRIVAGAALPGFHDLRPLVRTRMNWPLLLLLPCAMFGIGLDLLQLDRRAHMFFLTTSPGASLGTLAFFVTAAIVLPMWFRVAFGVVDALPEPVGSHLRRTAALLGFPPSRVLLLPTGNRAMNAMMVGPLPVGRFLCLTDGLVSSLDQESLAGVVAHEVGHAQKGHPRLLMTLAVVVPLFLPPIVGLVDLPDFEILTKAMLALGGVVLAWTLVRAIAHRFEHEADAASVVALGAGPCSRALMTVSRLAIPGPQGVLRRLLSLHPEEGARWEFMRRYEGDPAFRARFETRSRALRRFTLALLLIATFGAMAAWTVEWPFERAIWRFQSGDFRGAQRLVAAIGDDVPQRWQEPWKRLRAELDVAVQIAPDAEDWPTARASIASKAMPRAIETLRSSGPAAAAPWFSLARDVDDSALCGALLEYCRTTDDDRREQAKQVVRRLGVPAGLEAVFAK